MEIPIEAVLKYPEVLDAITNVVVWWDTENYSGISESLHQNFTKFTHHKKATTICKQPLINNTTSDGVTILFKTNPGNPGPVEPQIQRHRCNLYHITSSC